MELIRINCHKDILINDIGIERYNHSLRVMKVASELANRHDVNVEKAKIAAYYHDCAKFKSKTILLKRAESFDIIKNSIMEKNTELIHAPLSAEIAKKDYGIKDKEILEAIKNHTTGGRYMSKLDKIIYLADYIEPERNFPGVEIARKLAYEDLDKGMLFALDNTIKYLIDKKQLISTETVEIRNELLENLD